MQDQTRKMLQDPSTWPSFGACTVELIEYFLHELETENWEANPLLVECHKALVAATLKPEPPETVEPVRRGRPRKYSDSEREAVAKAQNRERVRRHRANKALKA